MKAVIIKAREGVNLKVGDAVEVSPEEFSPLYSEGYAVTATEYAATQNILKARESAVDAEIDSAISREAIVPKDDKAKGEIRANALVMESVKSGLGVEFIRAMKGKAAADLEQRHVPRVTDGEESVQASGVRILSGDLRSAGSAYLKLQNDQKAILKAGGTGMLKTAIQMSQDASALIKREIFPVILKGGGDFYERDIVKAADNVDPNVGTLATGIVLMRNLGFLKNKLSFIDKISTDLRNEPVAFGQNVISRYITPPGVLTYVPGVGLTSDATAIANWQATITAANPAGTPITGTQTRSVASTTDVPVVINNYKGVSITFNNLTLGGTMRNLFAEQQGASFYSLAEEINKDFLKTIFGTTWTGAARSEYSLCAGADPVGTPATNPMGLPVIIAIKNAFSLNKMPDVGRFVLLHSIYHDAILVDANLLNAKAILALIKKDAGSFEDGELPTLFGIKVLESQLAAASLAGNALGGAATLVSLTSPNGVQAAIGGNHGVVGFGGNSASALFAARIPQDYTKVLPEIPATASLEIVTEPDSGLSILLTKRVDHNLQATFMDTGLMYGFAPGDKRQGFNLNA